MESSKNRRNIHILGKPIIVGGFLEYSYVWFGGLTAIENGTTVRIYHSSRSYLTATIHGIRVRPYYICISILYKTVGGWFVVSIYNVYKTRGRGVGELYGNQFLGTRWKIRGKPMDWREWWEREIESRWTKRTHASLCICSSHHQSGRREMDAHADCYGSSRILPTHPLAASVQCSADSAGRSVIHTHEYENTNSVWI